MKYVRRGLFASFTFGLVVTALLMVITATRSRGIEGSGSVTTEFLTLTFFTSTREVTPDGTSFSLTPGFGVFVLLVVLPALTAALAWRKARRAAPTASAGRA